MESSCSVAMKNPEGIPDKINQKEHLARGVGNTCPKPQITSGATPSAKVDTASPRSKTHAEMLGEAEEFEEALIETAIAMSVEGAKSQWKLVC